MRPKTTTNAQRMSSPATRPTRCQTLISSMGRVSVRRSIDRRPLREGEDQAGNPPTQRGQEDEKRQRRIKPRALEDFPARIDGGQRRDHVVMQSMMCQSVLLVGGGDEIRFSSMLQRTSPLRSGGPLSSTTLPSGSVMYMDGP